MVVHPGGIAARRFSAIWKFNTGQYDNLIDPVAFRFPRQLRVKLAELSQPKEEGTAWNAQGTLVMADSGIAIDLGQRCQAKAIDLSLDGNDTYRIVYRLQGSDVAEQEVRPGLLKVVGLNVYRLDVPGKALRKPRRLDSHHEGARRVESRRCNGRSQAELHPGRSQ